MGADKEKHQGGLMIVISVILTGMLGAVARFYADFILNQLTGSRFPWSTLLINWVGSIAIGVLYGISQIHAEWAQLMHILMMGFLGAFTTFSTFSLQWILRTIEQSAGIAIVYIALSVFGGVTLAGIGWKAALYFL